MSLRLWTIGLVSLGFGIAHAQTPVGGDMKRTAPGEITVTGCVERADQVSEAVTAGTTVDSLSFVLIKARNGTAADAGAVATSGTPKSTEKGSMYRLDAEVATLNPHVGHKVEVTGTLVSASSTAPAGSGNPESATNAPKLKVGRVKMLSETCGR